MPIEGSWNTFKAFFLTEAILSSPDSYNTFANGSLWYVQYFFGRETIQQDGEKFYLVQSPKTSGNASWISLSKKITAYFFSALVWTIPGTLARLLSFDSIEASSAIFAERITPRPKTPKVRPLVKQTVSKLGSDVKDPTSALFAKKIVSQTPLATREGQRPDLPLLDLLINPLNKEDGSSKPEDKEQRDVLKSDNPPAMPAAEPKTAIVNPASLAARAENQAQILKEVEQAIVFFADLNQRTNNPQKLKKWLKAEQAKPTYLQPFYFSHHLKWAFEKNQGKIERVIPPEILSKWKKEFEESSGKLKRLGLEAYLNDEVEEKKNTLSQTPKDIDDDLQKGINSYKELFTLKNNHAEWLEKNQIVCLLFMTLYWLSMPEMGLSLDEGKLKLLGGFYSRCKRRRRELKLDAYLKERPKIISPGLYSLVRYLTEHLTQSPEQPSPALVKAATLAPAPAKPSELKVSDVELKKLLILGAPILKTIPGLTAILENNRLFQLHKFKLVTFINNDWKFLVSKLTDFLDKPFETPEEKSLLVASIEAPKGVILRNAHPYKAPFSERYLQLIGILQPILEETVYTKWMKLYRQCQERLRKVHLTFYLKEEIPNHFRALEEEEVEMTAQLFDRVIHFFKNFLKPANTATWLDQEARKEMYCFPFFYSFDLQCKLPRLQSRLNQSFLSEWKELYAQSLSKVEALNLKKHLDEFPPTLLDSLVTLSDHILVGEYLTRNMIDMLNTNQPSQGQVIGTTRGAFSSNPLTAAQWTTLSEDPEKVPDLAKKMSAQATSFFEELDQLPDQQEKVELWLKSKTSSANSYPFFFTRFMLFSGRTLLKRYKKIITAKAVENLEALHVRACCKLLGLGLTSYLNKTPNAFEMKPITLNAEKVGLMNKALQSHLLFLKDFLSLEPKKAQTFLAEKEQIEKEISETIPRIFHWEKFADAQLFKELKSLFPQYINKLHQLRHPKK